MEYQKYRIRNEDLHQLALAQLAHPPLVSASYEERKGLEKGVMDISSEKGNDKEWW